MQAGLKSTVPLKLGAFLCNVAGDTVSGRHEVSTCISQFQGLLEFLAPLGAGFGNPRSKRFDYGTTSEPCGNSTNGATSPVRRKGEKLGRQFLKSVSYDLSTVYRIS